MMCASCPPLDPNFISDPAPEMSVEEVSPGKFRKSLGTSLGFEVAGTYKFVIKNFLQEMEKDKNNQVFLSPTFDVSSRVGEQEECFCFAIGVFLKSGMRPQSFNNGCSVGVIFYNKNDFDVQFSFNYRIEDSSGSMAYHHETGKKQCVSPQHGCGVPCSLRRSKFIYKKDELLPGGNLTLVCDIRVEVKLGKCCQCQRSVSIQGSLGQDLLPSLGQSKFSDMKIVCEGREFECHKLILASRSDVFNAMLENDYFQEAHISEIQIRDMDTTTLENFLQFLYTDKVKDEVLKEHAANLFRAADKYNVVNLRDLCEQYMWRNIDEDTAVEFLILAHLHSAKDLKRVAMTFVLGEISRIERAEEWEMLKEYPDLTAEIFQNLQ